VHFCTEFRGTKLRGKSHQPVGILYDGRVIVLGKTYFTKQASLLLKLAQSTSDAELSAKLVSKAADLKSQGDPLPDKDQSPKAPDVSS
jgi:hypothetical protein